MLPNVYSYDLITVTRCESKTSTNFINKVENELSDRLYSGSPAAVMHDDNPKQSDTFITTERRKTCENFQVSYGSMCSLVQYLVPYRKLIPKIQKDIIAEGGSIVYAQYRQYFFQYNKNRR